MASKIYKDDTGTVFLVDCGIDLTEATAVSLFVRDPGETIHEWTGATVHAQKYIRYVAQTSDLSAVGTYRLQASVTFNTNHWLGETASFVVYDNFM